MYKRLNKMGIGSYEEKVKLAHHLVNQSKRLCEEIQSWESLNHPPIGKHYRSPYIDQRRRRSRARVRNQDATTEVMTNEDDESGPSSGNSEPDPAPLHDEETNEGDGSRSSSDNTEPDPAPPHDEETNEDDGSGPSSDDPEPDPAPPHDEETNEDDESGPSSGNPEPDPAPSHDEETNEDDESGPSSDNPQPDPAPDPAPPHDEETSNPTELKFTMIRDDGWSVELPDHLRQSIANHAYRNPDYDRFNFVLRSQQPESASISNQNEVYSWTANLNRAT